MLNEGKTNNTVYTSILNLIRKCDEETPWPDSRNWIYWGFIYYSKGNFFFILLQVSPFGEWNKLKIYNCIVFTGFEPQNFIFLKVSAGGLVLTYSSARYFYKHLYKVYKVYCYRKKCNPNPRTMSDPYLTDILWCTSNR